MADSFPTPSFISRSGLMTAYVTLKTKHGRFLEHSHISPLEDFYEKVGRSLGLSQTQYTLTNSEVEQFYTDQTSETNFVATAESRLIRAALSPVSSPVSSLSTCPLGSGTVNTGQPGLTSAEVKLFGIIWDMYSLTSDIKSLSTKIPRICGLCLWQMFLCLDSDMSKKVPVTDVYDLVNLIFKVNGHSIELETVKEWFCGESAVNFQCFLQSLVEGYTGLLQTSTIQELYTIICLKRLKQGRMMKKGHVVHNWKGRWFILTTADIKYYESQESLVPKGCINITSSSQVQTMGETKGHPYKFRVVDGITGTGTEISCSDEQTRREWMDSIKLAIKLNTTEGNNFVKRYCCALESLPKTARGSIFKLLRSSTPSPTTSPTHKSLAASKSVPINNVVNGNGKGKRRLPMIPDETVARTLPPSYQEEHRQMARQQPSLDQSLEEPPPVPPQRLNSGDIRGLQIGREPLAEYNVMGVKGSTRSPKSSLRRTSSAGDLEESIKHLQVGEEEYALIITKGPKKQKKVSTPEVGNQRERYTEPKQRPKKKKSPPLPFQNRKSVETSSSYEEGDRNQNAVSSGKSKTSEMSYAELRFYREGGDESQGSTVQVSKPSVTSNAHRSGGELPTTSIPHDPKTKYGYSTILFDESKQKDIIAAEKLKKERGAPPPIPNKYKGGNDKAKKLRQYMSDTNALAPKEQKFQGKARPISAGTSRTPATTALKVHNGVNKPSFGDYEELDFEDDEEEFDNVPRKSRNDVEVAQDHRVLVLPPDRQGSSGYEKVELVSEDRSGRQSSRQPGASGYENVDLESNDKFGKVTDKFDRMHSPLPPLPTKEPPLLQAAGNPRPATRPAHLLQQQPRTGNGASPVNHGYPPTSAPPQPKPRVTPRKGLPTPTTNTPPIPPRKIS